jgi:NAD(P)-dependent dehydrogenase (short-subunit alcohol dehydrogenase family)
VAITYEKAADRGGEVVGAIKGRRGLATQDIAEAVAFLASPKAKYITGSTLTVNGGANA